MNCQVNTSSGYIQVDGSELPLPHKTQQVLLLIVEAAPGVVSRDHIIEKLWPASYSTGDKGLRQAIWAIRSALGDAAGEPLFIRTIPRSGYQWIGPSLGAASDQKTYKSWKAHAARHIPTGLLSLALAMGLSATGPELNNVRSPPGDSKNTEFKVSNVFVQGQSVIVDYESGCRAILKSETGLLAGDPIMSGDGSHLMIPVIRDQSCQLVMFEPGTRTITRFGACPEVPAFFSPLPATSEKTI